MMVGEGVVVYNLCAPWGPYLEPRPPFRPAKPSHDQEWGLPQPTATDQWWEYRRYPPNPLRLLSVTHVEGERFEATSVIQTDDGPTRWAILAESKVVKALNWLPDIP